MPEAPLHTTRQTTELRKNGVVVGLTDRIYQVTGPTVHFDEILVKGDLSGELQYNGSRVTVKKIDTVIGMLVDERGPRGPVWKSVECDVNS